MKMTRFSTRYQSHSSILKLLRHSAQIWPDSERLTLSQDNFIHHHEGHEEHEEKKRFFSGFVTFVFFVVNPHSNSVARTGRGRISPVALKLV
jgi:hypothetical protein